MTVGTIGGAAASGDPVAAIWAAIRELQKQIREQGAAPSLQASSVGAGGIVITSPDGLTIEDGGGVTVQDGGTLTLQGGGGVTVTDGTVQVFDTGGDLIASLGVDPTNPDYRGLVTHRTDGSVMLGSYGQGFLGLSATLIYDRAGNAVLFDDGVFKGLGSPYIPMGQWTAYPPVIPQTSSTSLVTQHVLYAYRQHARVFLSAVVSSSAVGTTGEIQLLDPSNAPVGGTLAIPANATTFVTLGPIAWPAWAWHDSGYFSLQCRVTAGAGTVGVLPTAFVGMGSS